MRSPGHGRSYPAFRSPVLLRYCQKKLEGQEDVDISQWNMVTLLEVACTMFLSYKVVCERRRSRKQTTDRHWRMIAYDCFGLLELSCCPWPVYKNDELNLVLILRAERALYDAFLLLLANPKRELDTHICESIYWNCGVFIAPSNITTTT